MTTLAASYWRALFSLTVAHPYFESGRMAACLLRPAADTQGWMRRFDLRLRQADGRFDLLGEHARLAAASASLPDEALCFDLLARDPAAAYYTDMRSLAADGDFHLGDGGELVDEPRAAGRPAGALARLVLSPRHWRQQPAAAVDFQLVLPERQTFWKYLLAGAWKEAPHIADARGQVDFAGPARESLPGGAQVWAFRSRQPIGLRERPSQRFQLWEGGERGRLLFDRLPMASPQALTRENVDGAWLDVSEIFVNR